SAGCSRPTRKSPSASASWRKANGRRAPARCWGKAERGPGMKARVVVTLKSGVLDPQGKAIEGALKSLGLGGVAGGGRGKVFDIELEGGDPAKAEQTLREAAEKLLANTVIENFKVEVTAPPPQAAAATS